MNLTQRDLARIGKAGGQVADQHQVHTVHTAGQQCQKQRRQQRIAVPEHRHKLPGLHTVYRFKLLPGIFRHFPA